MSQAQIDPPSLWIPRCIISILVIIITGYILSSEIKQRQNNEQTTSFTTGWLKWFSLACITSSFLQYLSALMGFIPGLCTFNELFLNIFLVSVYISMGYYQLSRLYYCFSNESIHSKRGYPKWIFVFMFVFGAIFGLGYLVFWFSFDEANIFRSKCEYHNGQFHSYFIQPFPTYQGADYYATFCVLVVAIWDFLTLLLYIVKIKQFTKHNNNRSSSISSPRSKEIDDDIQKKIKLILYKIATLTIFYQFIIVLCIILLFLFAGIVAYESMFYQFLSTFLIAIASLSYTISIYLMMDHNKEKYFKFLNVILCIKLHWICCCFKNMVVEQKDNMDENVQNIASGMEVTKTASSELSVPVPQMNHKKSGNSMSIETAVDSTQIQV